MENEHYDVDDHHYKEPERKLKYGFACDMSQLPDIAGFSENQAEQDSKKKKVEEKKPVERSFLTAGYGVIRVVFIEHIHCQDRKEHDQQEKKHPENAAE